MNHKIIAAIVFVSILIAAGAFYVISNNESDNTAADSRQSAPADTQDVSPVDTPQEQATASGEAQTYTIDVWADNWFALYVNGEFVGEDSVPITTERSFNKETFNFSATTPVTVAIEAKDFKETDSGIEYIGQNNQQMGDGGLIAQIKDAAGNVVATTSGDWRAFVTHFAPVNKSCESSSNPDTDCEFIITDTPSDWFTASFDDSDWQSVTTYSQSQVSPKDGYDEVSWSNQADFIWGEDLEQVNTVLLRTTF